VRKKCVFTTHTPVPAGHDRFSTEQSIRILGGDRTARLEKQGCFRDDMLNMTLLALRFSRYANGVAMQHGKVSREMFPEFAIDTITNGVHAPTWVSKPVQQMLDEHIPAWRRDNLYLRNAIDLPEAEIQAAHARAKATLLEEVASRTGQVLNPKLLTLGFARRVATYKRATLLFTSGWRRSPPRPAVCRFSMPARPIRRTSPASRSSSRSSRMPRKFPTTCCGLSIWKTTTGAWARCSRLAWMSG
jgi:starch phosphorylase